MSRGLTFTKPITIVLVTETCCECGVLFGMTADYRQRRLDDKHSWYCPNGHSQSYIGKSLTEQLAEQKRLTANAEEEARIQAARTDAEAAKVRAEALRLRKRAAAGACPCCNRTFVQLSRHLKTKHPDYTVGGAS